MVAMRLAGFDDIWTGSGDHVRNYVDERFSLPEVVQLRALRVNFRELRTRPAEVGGSLATSLAIHSRIYADTSHTTHSLCQ